MTSGDARILLLLPQFPLDPSSGAVRNLRVIGEQLAIGGFAVHCCGTTALELASPSILGALLDEVGVRLPRTGAEYGFRLNCVQYRILHTGTLPMSKWDSTFGRKFDLVLEREIAEFRPHIVFTFGGSQGDARRREIVRRSGAQIVFSVQNEHYLDRAFFEGIEHVVTCSNYLSDLYRREIGLESHTLLPAIDPDGVIAEEHDPIFVTMINPSPEKGVVFFARIAEEIGKQRPDIPMLVIDSRANAETLISAGMAGGFDLRRHENIMSSQPVSRPAEIYAKTRVLLVPSLWREAAGRVVPEAMLNGVPAIVSDRGGLAEMCNGAGFVLHIPPGVTPLTKTPVPAEMVQPWLDIVFRMEDDPEFYRQQSEAARRAGQKFLPANQKQAYLNYFASIAARTTHP